MLAVVYIVRHAFRANWTVDPQSGIYSASLVKSPTGIPTDPPLTSKGVQQSEQLAEHLCQLKPPIESIYSSPFYRCLQTLKPTVDRLHTDGKLKEKIRVDRGIGEFFGRADWNHPAPPDLIVLSPLFEHLDEHHVSPYEAPPQGELIVELHDRVGKALNHIISTLDSEQGQPRTVLLCTHAATMIAAGRVLTGQMPEDLDKDDFQCYTAGLSKFVRRSLDPSAGVLGNWDCVLNSDTSYLSGGAERGWKFNGEESFVAFPGSSIDGKKSPRL